MLVVARDTPVFHSIQAVLATSSHAQDPYCRGDVCCTQDLLNCAKAELDLYGFTDLLPDRAYSPASLGKAAFRAMGIVPPSEKFKTPNELQGIFMQAYFGGRAECHIRKINLPIMKLDFLSQYPTVNTLLDNWKILTAQSVSYPECTAEIRRFLNKVEPRKWLDKCFKRETWPQAPTLKFCATLVNSQNVRQITGRACRDVLSAISGMVVR